ncbi:MAG: Xaa-Pro peptidase family protein [Thermoplasmatales archaeon]|nr:Xaa-Pro peptidase family protein [Thermoplasmatales archaeon]
MDNKFWITKEEFEGRRKKVQDEMRKEGYDGLVIFSGYVEREGHVCYLTNHHSSFPNVMSHKGLGYSAYVLPSEGEGALVAPFGFEEDKVVNIGSAQTGMNIVEGLKSAISDTNLYGKRLGVIGSDIIPAEYYLNLTDHLGKKLDRVDHIEENLRAIKSEAELRILRESALVSDAGLKAGMESVKEGKKELDIALAATNASIEAGADMIARVRISSGKHLISLRWPMATDREIKKGDFVYIDFIGFYKNYGFDVQRIKTVGEATSEQKAALTQAKEAEEWMIDLMKPGKTIKLIKASSRGFRIDPFMHGIGLEICETPSCMLEGSSFKVQEHMVLCVEPSAGNNEFGDLALEDMIEVTNQGAKVLNKYSRELW